MEAPRSRSGTLRKGFLVFLGSMEHQSTVLSMGTIKLKPGFLRVSRWVKNFNHIHQKQTNAQCWIRLYDLPMEYMGMVNLFNIARGDGMPLKINPTTQRASAFSRVLVGVDCSKDLPKKILVQRRTIGINFFASLYYEFVPHYYHCYGTLGHKAENCRMA